MPRTGMSPSLARAARPIHPEGTPSGRGRDPVGPSGLHEPLADRVADELDPVAHAELGEDVRAMALDGLLADDQQLGDLARRVRLRDELEHLGLARGQRPLLERAALPDALEPVAHERAD